MPSSNTAFLGSELHKLCFCQMFLDTHDPYKPAVMDWPKLSDEELQRITSLPIWDMAVQTEGRAGRNVSGYADTIRDPLLKKAISMNAFEELRHKEVLSHLVRAYGIPLAPEPEYEKPRDPEWGFTQTGYSECIDSFFAFGLFELARRSGYFPKELVETFEPVIREESRHILFFVNWVYWHRRNLSLFKRMWFDVRRIAIFFCIIWGRIKTIRGAGGGHNFTANGQQSIGIKMSFYALLSVCLAENDRRMQGFDSRLLRPTFVPRIFGLVHRYLGRKRQQKA